MFDNLFKNWFKPKLKSVTGRSYFIGLSYRSEKKDLGAMALEGYAGNPIVYKCVSEIATNSASIQLKLMRKQKDALDQVDGHELLTLLDQPNPFQSGSDFIEELVTHYQYSGNCFIRKIMSGNRILQLELLDPRFMARKYNQNGDLIAYEYRTDKRTQRFEVDPITNNSEILHFKMCNPLDIGWGLSPLDAAGLSVDIHNNGMKFNEALLRNGARPSGVLYSPNVIDDYSFSRLREMVKETFQGAKNAGEVPILDNGLDWKEIGLNPKDLDFERCMNMMARNIAAVYGVPFPLIIPETATYDNMRESREALFEHVICPLMNKITEALTKFLTPHYADGKQLLLTYSEDDIPALENKRQRKFERMTTAVTRGIATINEARRQLGFDDLPNADTLLVPSSLIPLELAGIGLTQDPTQASTPVKTLMDAGYSENEAVRIATTELGIK